MTQDDIKNTEEKVKKSIFKTAQAWGESSLPPTLLATLILPQHARPLRPLPLLFPPLLLFTSYLNLSGFKADAGGTSAAFSTLYILLASRRKHRVKDWVSVRGGIRGVTLGLCAVNALGGGLAYVFGKRGEEERPE